MPVQEVDITAPRRETELKASGSGTTPEPPKKRGRWLGAPWWAWLIGGFVVLSIVSAIAGGGSDSASNDSATQAAQKVSPNEALPRPAPKSNNEAPAQPAPAQPAPAQPAPEPEPEMTAGQENALQSGQDYIDLMAFSKAGLIGQLSSSAADGFSRADATFAANHVDVDWNAEAVESAQDYLDMMAFSKSGLIEQLSSSAGDQFTRAQAEYAANQVYGG